MRTETTGGTPCPVCGFPTWSWANHVCGGTVEPSWQSRALAAESKLARLEGLERAARDWFDSGNGDHYRNAYLMFEAVRAYFTEGSAQPKVTGDYQ